MASYSALKKEINHEVFKKMNGSGNYHIKWGISDSETQMMHVPFTYRL